MGDINCTGQPPQSHATSDTTMKPSAQHAADLITKRSTRTLHDLQQLERHDESTLRWFTTQYDFERRLSRFGIRISEDNGEPASDPIRMSTVHTRGGGHTIPDSYTRHAKEQDTVSQASAAEASRQPETPTIASFTNKKKKEHEVEAVERQLQQACVEVQIWKEKCEAQKRDLRDSYKETMQWRMKYEDLYSTIIQDQQFHPRERGKRVGTKSLG